MIGDGTYLMMNSEIVTAVTEGLSLTIVIIDNHGYQCILGLQRICGVSDFGNELRFRDPKSGLLNGEYIPIDFVKHAEAMGAHAVLVKTAAEITAALKDAKHRKGVSVVLIPADPEKRMPRWELGGMSRWQKSARSTRRARPGKTMRRPPRSSAPYSHEARYCTCKLE